MWNARKNCAKFRQLCERNQIFWILGKYQNSSRMATSNIWSEGYWRNVSFVQGLLCAAEVITIFIFSCPKTGQFKSWVASGVCKIFNYIPSLKCTMCNGNVQCAMKIYIEKLSGHPLSYIFSPTPQLSTGGTKSWLSNVQVNSIVIPIYKNREKRIF